VCVKPCKKWKLNLLDFFEKYRGWLNWWITTRPASWPNSRWGSYVTWFLYGFFHLKCRCKLICRCAWFIFVAVASIQLFHKFCFFCFADYQYCVCERSEVWFWSTDVLRAQLAISKCSLLFRNCRDNHRYGVSNGWCYVQLRSFVDLRMLFFALL